MILAIPKYIRSGEPETLIPEEPESDIDSEDLNATKSNDGKREAVIDEVTDTDTDAQSEESLATEPETLIPEEQEAESAGITESDSSSEDIDAKELYVNSSDAPECDKINDALTSDDECKKLSK